MTNQERDMIRTERDRAQRVRLSTLSDYEARRRRLYAACCPDSPVKASNQVRSVMRMLENAR